MAGRYPKEFKEDVIRVARDRKPGETLEQIAHDFGVHSVTLSKWLRQAALGRLAPIEYEAIMTTPASQAA